MKQFVFYGFMMIMLNSCMELTGSGNIVNEKRQTGSFTGISVGGAFEVQIKNGPETEVIVESDDNIIKYIETKVSGNVLKIRTKDGTGFSQATFKVSITSPEINLIRVSGASNVKGTSQLKSAGKISLDVSGAGGIKASLDAPEIDSELSGAGNMELEGRTRDYKASVSGSGELKSADLLSEHTNVSVSGAGTARVHASVSLKAHATGAGNIHYKGGASVEQKTSGAGNIKSDN